MLYYTHSIRSSSGSSKKAELPRRTLASRPSSSSTTTTIIIIVRQSIHPSIHHRQSSWLPTKRRSSADKEQTKKGQNSHIGGDPLN
eukprot:scaffold34609_cov146-Amphora_coffeaeformis.AAC.3